MTVARPASVQTLRVSDLPTMSRSSTSGAKGGEPAVPTLELARTPGHLIRRAQRVHNVIWSDVVGAEPTGPQFAVLSSVARRPGLDQKALGALSSLDKSTTTDVVRRLVRHGWLTRTLDEDDRRRSVLHLSPPARAALASLTEQADVVQTRLLEPLTPIRRSQLITDLAALAYEGDPPESPSPGSDGLGLELADAPGHLIRRAQQAYTARWTNAFRGRITGPQYAVLCALAIRQPADQVTLGEVASLDRTSTAEVVERLAAQDLITVVTDSSDRRRKALRLSETAIRELPSITSAAADVQSQLLDLLPQRSRRRLLDHLAAVAYQRPVSLAEPSA